MQKTQKIDTNNGNNRATPVILWKIDKTEVNWGLYMVKWGERGLYNCFLFLEILLFLLDIKNPFLYR